MMVAVVPLAVSYLTQIQQIEQMISHTEYTEYTDFFCDNLCKSVC